MPTQSDKPEGAQKKQTRQEAHDFFEPSITVRDAASRFCREHWHDGLHVAGADSNYTAYWAFCAGAKLNPDSAAQAERIRVLEGALQKAINFSDRPNNSQDEEELCNDLKEALNGAA